MGNNPVRSCFGMNNKKTRLKLKGLHIEDNIYQNSVESIEDYGIEVEDKYRGTLVYHKDSDGNLIYKRRKNLIFTARLSKICNSLNLTEQNIIKVWKFFKLLDQNSIGYINIEKIYQLVDEDPSNSTICPIVDRFFIEINKEYSDKVSFEELLPSLVCFCLFSSYHLMQFIFEFIDKDKKEYVTREDIVNYLELERDGKRLELYNHAETMKYTNLIKRSDKITFEDFELLCKRFPFIYYSAIIFQEKLRENYINKSFWMSLLNQVADRHIINMKMIEKRKIEGKIEEIQENIIQDKVKAYKQKLVLQIKEEKNDKIYEELFRQGINNDEMYFKKFYYNNGVFNVKDKNELIKSMDNIDIKCNFDNI